MKKLLVVTSLSAIILLAIGYCLLKNDDVGRARLTVTHGRETPVGSAGPEGIVTASESSALGPSFESPHSQVKRLPPEQKGEPRSDSAFFVALRQKDLFGSYIESANGGGIEGTSTAAYISSVCLPYMKGRSEPFKLPEDHLRRLTANGERNISASRERLSEVMLERCKGFIATDKYMTALTAIRTNLKQAGVENPFGPDDSIGITESKSLAINKVFQNPDSYLGVMMVSTNDIFPRLGAAVGGENVTAIEARLAFEVGMCQLGVDCGRDSIGSMNAVYAMKIRFRTKQQFLQRHMELTTNG